MKLRSLLVSSLVAIAAASSAMPASAVAPKEALSCDLKEPLGKLAALKADGSEAAEELSLRKEILKASMECNAREAGSFSAGVASLTDGTRVTDSLRKSYSSQLEAAATYARDAASRVDTLTSVSSSKDLARELKEWRQASYNPLAWQSSQLMVLYKNLELADSAAERSEQLAVRIALMDSTDESKALKDQNRQANALIEDAGKDLSEALALLKNGGIAQQAEIAEKQKDGLDALSRAYSLLIATNDRIAAIPAETPAP